MELASQNRIKKETKNALLHSFLISLIVVTLKGVEPSTAGAEIQCSIQLSYKANIFLSQ
ncbi:MAG: hypothetical protein RIT03_91 [Bacteroidota bacterium]